MSADAAADGARRFFFTVDVDWIPGSESGLTGLYDFCAEQKLLGTFFVTGRMAVDYPDIVRQAAERGHELGTHGWEHGQLSASGEENFSAASYKQQSDWVSRSTDAVERASGQRPVCFRAPNLKVGETTLKVLTDQGYAYDSSVPARRLTVTYGRLNSARYYWAPLEAYHPSEHHLGKVGSSSLIEIPPSAFFLPLNLSALRVFGFKALRWTVDRIARRSRDLVFFSHPAEFVEARHQQLARDNPKRHLEGIGPANFELLRPLVDHVRSLGYRPALFGDVKRAPGDRYVG